MRSTGSTTTSSVSSLPQMGSVSVCEAAAEIGVACVGSAVVNLGVTQAHYRVRYPPIHPRLIHGGSYSAGWVQIGMLYAALSDARERKHADTHMQPCTRMQRWHTPPYARTCNNL